MAWRGRARLARFKTGRRTPRESTCRTYVDLASASTSAGVDPDNRIVFYLHRRLRVLVLDADDAATAHRMDGRRANRMDRRDPIYWRTRRNIGARLEFRSHARTPLAFCRSTIDRGRRIDRVARVSAFEPVACRAVYAGGIWDGRLFAGVLGIAFGILECFGRCGGRGLH